MNKFYLSDHWPITILRGSEVTHIRIMLELGIRGWYIFFLSTSSTPIFQLEESKLYINLDTISIL